MENKGIRDLPKKSARDIVPGDTFGKLTVLEKDKEKHKDGTHWICRCECGNITSVCGCNLTLEKTKSCGCSRHRKGKENPHFKDLTGQTFGNLTVQEVDRERTEKCSYGTYWICKCSCGNTTSVSESKLTGRKIKSCGCRQHKKGVENPAFKDLTGRKFGHLTVMGPDTTRGGDRTYFFCRCDCGKEVSVYSQHLISEQTKSCGCLNHRKGRDNPGFDDITGQQFGELTVMGLDEDMTENRKGTYWKCRCSCGRIISVKISNLKSENTQSCGCVRGSHGEKNINEYLIRHGFRENEDYNRQKKFDDLKGDADVCLSFDFDIKAPERFLLEYQGIQHYRPVDRFGGEEQFKVQQRYDALKRDYAEEHGIPLYCIPYTDNTYDKISEAMDRIMADAKLQSDMRAVHKKRAVKIKKN